MKIHISVTGKTVAENAKLFPSLSEGQVGLQTKEEESFFILAES